MRSRYGLKRVLAGAICLVMLLCAGLPAGASSVSDLETDISEQEKKEQEARAEAARYRTLYDELQKELEEANAGIDALFDEMLELGRQIAEAEAEIERYAAQQEENEKTLAEQKETMAKRIQYMYEQQGRSFWEVLTGASSLAEVMNSADYIRSLSEYDSKMMESYKATLAEKQVGGKLKTTVTVASDCSDEDIVKAACADEKICRLMQGMELVKTIVVKGRLVNLILKPQQ